MRIKYYRNEQGLTLIELLAVLAIGSLIMISLVSVQIFVQKQYDRQSTKINELTDITIAAKAITKEIRSAGEVKPVDQTNEIILILENDEISYRLEDNILKKNDAAYIHKVKQFNLELNQEESKVILKIAGESGQFLETEIVLREGDSQNDESAEE